MSDLPLASSHPSLVLHHQANVTAMVARTAAAALLVYETEHDGTFAFLPHRELRAVTEAYQRSWDLSEREVGLSDLADAVGLLLGLETEA